MTEQSSHVCAVENCANETEHYVRLRGSRLEIIDVPICASCRLHLIKPKDWLACVVTDAAQNMRDFARSPR